MTQKTTDQNSFFIDVHNLSKKFGKKTVVNNVTIQIPQGKIYGFLGPNGSGKTTTMRMICGLLTPDSGEGTCMGYDILTQSSHIRFRMGYMTQKFSYWEDLSIRENLDFVAHMFSIPHKKTTVDQALERLGLEKRQNQLVGGLSGGWKQRLALAACTLHDPKILLLDEPTAGVDPKARREFWDTIHSLVSKGLTALVTTHYMDEVERCHEILYITGGRLMTKGTIPQVIAQSGLKTWIVTGGNLSKLYDDLQKDLRQQNPSHQPEDLLTVAPFGHNLHISGANSKKLENLIQNYKKNSPHTWFVAQPSMEDVFIHYMTKAQIENEL